MPRYKNVSALSDTFRTELLSPSDVRVADAVEQYKQKWTLPESAHPAAERWYGVFKNDRVILVVGEKREGDTVDVTDMYPHPSASKREVVAAIYAMLNVYATGLRRKLFKSLVCTVLFRNKAFQRAVERVFNVVPTAVIYMAEVA